MCQKCKKKSCSGCGSDNGKQVAELLNVVQDLKDTIDQIAVDTAWLKGGHPILQLFDPAGIALFDMSSGLGSGVWNGWAVCDGQTQEDNITGLPFPTPPLMNLFIVAAGDIYVVGDTGGVDEVTLTLPKIPIHNHPVSDPGHTHGITDPGHDHGASSGPHTHTFTGNPHTHVAADAGLHQHRFTMNTSWQYASGAAVPSQTQEDVGTDSDMLTDNAGTHTHDISSATASGTVGNTSAGVNVDEAFTGITNNTATTGVTVGNSGGSEAHENRPPYFALLFIIKL